MTIDKQAFRLYALAGIACLAAAWLVAGRPSPIIIDRPAAPSPQRSVAPGPQPTASIELTGRHILEKTLISAFVPTGSTSKKCLLTLAESNAASPGATVFCAHRRYRGANGIIVRIYLAVAPPPTVIMQATVHHDGANRYGRPILYR